MPATLSSAAPAVLLLIGLLVVPVRAQTPYPFQNPDLPVEARVRDLVGRMTLEEKVNQMKDRAPAIERLGIPEYNWWNEALHGVARAGLATSFPQAVGLAATWDEDLIHRMARVIAMEARAKHHEALRNGEHRRYQGLTMWSPNINIFRDPRWGRGQETYGEDPFLTGRLGVQFVRGLQGNDPRYFETVATVKHFAVHSGPEPERHTFDAVVNERDLRETYLPHFEVGIREGGAYSLMCAHNRVNGEAACSSEMLLQDILRDEWGFDGFIVSDCWALDDIHLNHKIEPTVERAAARALRAGTDLDCGNMVYPHLAEAVAQGLVSEAAVDTAVTRLFRARFRLGMFDPPARVPFAQIPFDSLDTPANQALAREVAQKSIVLLKNEGGLLPLRKDLGTLAVLGPNANEWLMLLGNYHGFPSDPVTPLRGIREAVGPNTQVLYARGANLAEGLPVYDSVPTEVLRTPDGQPGLLAEYFGTHAISGTPRHREVVPLLHVNWQAGAPRPDLNPDDFGARWTGTLTPTRSGAYHLGLITTTTARLYVDGRLHLEATSNERHEFGNSPLFEADSLVLEAGRTYQIRVESEETFGTAQVQLVWGPPQDALEAEAVAAAEAADAVVLVLGLTARLEGEEMDVQVPGFRGGDRTSLDLPAPQQALLERIHALGKPTVLVLMSGSALSVNWADEHIPAIVQAWYPGQAGGTALADVLFGDVNPSGRLPVTFYRSADDLPPFEGYDMAGRTYRFFEGQPLYPFGHGLSYTSFRYSNIRTNPRAPSDSITVQVDVTNAGERAGDEVVQLYVKVLDSAVARPVKDLKGFARVSLAPGERQTVTFTVAPQDVAYWDADADRWVVEPGRLELQLGASSSDIRQTTTVVVSP